MQRKKKSRKQKAISSNREHYEKKEKLDRDEVQSAGRRYRHIILTRNRNLYNISP